MPDKTTIESLAKNGKHFCVLPWVHFHAWPDKRVLPCCVADSDKPVAKIESDQSILEMMNSDQFKEIRSKMMNDQPVETCKRCYDLEVLGNWTMRQSHNTRRGEEYSQYIADVTNEDGSLKEFEMKYMDIRFSNLCNMKCRSCGPSCSSQWAQEYQETQGMEKWNKHFGGQKVVINNNEDQQLMTKLQPYLADVNEVYFAGGEIIITPEHYECLDYWVENNLTDQVELNYTTNFSTLRYKKSVDLLDYWKKFPNLQIWASLDAHGSLAECIRKGTDWSRIEQNIRDIKEKVPHAKFQITPTISIWNVFDFPEFLEYMIENNFISRDTAPRINMVTSPWWANIMILPRPVKRRLIEVYRIYQEKYKHNVDLYNGLSMIITNLKGGEENKGGILEFKKFNDELDQFRREKFDDIVKEIREVYKWAES